LAFAQQGQLYNAEDGRKALGDVFALGLFDNVQIFPKPSPKDESKVLASATIGVPLLLAGEFGTVHACTCPPQPSRCSWDIWATMRAGICSPASPLLMGTMRHSGRQEERGCSDSTSA
jgi:hypothetical protein